MTSPSTIRWASGTSSTPSSRSNSLGRGGIAGTGNYDGRITLSVEVEDISAGEGDPVGIGSFDLAGRDRQGDQGFTDIAAGGSAYNRNNDTAAFSLKLRSGGTYRIWFKAEAYGAPLLATLVESTIRGRWSELLVTIDEDSGALLTQIRNDLLQHDMDIKNDLAQHDTDIKADIATHDADIKALLAGLGADLAEIKRLLNTPTGRRPDFPIQE